MISSFYVNVPVQVLVEASDQRMAWNEAVSQVNASLNAAGIPNQIKLLGYQPSAVRMSIPLRLRLGGEDGD